jgi:hypothetical protein
LEDRRNVGENSCDSGDGTDRRVQSLKFMMMMMMMMIMMMKIPKLCFNSVWLSMVSYAPKKSPVFVHYPQSICK